MSNVTLAARIDEACVSYAQGTLALSELPDLLSPCVAALEGIPYKDTREMDSIVESLRIESYYAAEDCEFERQTAELIRKLRDLVARAVLGRAA